MNFPKFPANLANLANRAEMQLPRFAFPFHLTEKGYL
jgi:hypothetical protein